MPSWKLAGTVGGPGELRAHLDHRAAIPDASNQGAIGHAINGSHVGASVGGGLPIAKGVMVMVPVAVIVTWSPLAS